MLENLEIQKFERPDDRWNYFRDALIRDFGSLVYKVGVDAGFDCPNRDGNKAFGGCAYCSQEGSLSPHQDPKAGILEQIELGRAFVRKRYKAEKFIVYFQAFTNTYAPVSVLRDRFESALVDDSIVGLSVATRPDCVTKDNIAYLAELSERLPYFTLELGLQSAYQNRLEWVNRQESVEDYVKAMEMLNAHRIKTITHVILGFPGESRKEMADTVQLSEKMQSQGIKLQMLHVIKKTKLAHMHQKEPFDLMGMTDYGNLVIDLVERLNPKTVVHRITGETALEDLVAPMWVHQKPRFFDWFRKELVRRDTWQGKFAWDSMPL